MPERQILILDRPESPRVNFLEEFFEDTSAAVHTFHDLSAASAYLNGGGKYDLAFINSEIMTPAFVQKIKVLSKTFPHSRLFEIGSEPAKRRTDVAFDDVFASDLSGTDFQKQLVTHLPLPPVIHVLIADDEMEIGNMVCEFLERRVQPSFEVEHVENGVKAIQALQKKLPDILVLDIKMPFKDGREVYREIHKKKWNVPVIIFFDSVSGDEMAEIHQYGRPAVVEKGARQSAMPEMMALIKKMAYFG